jgi:hypothetical protein
MPLGKATVVQMVRNRWLALGCQHVKNPDTLERQHETAEPRISTGYGFRWLLEGVKDSDSFKIVSMLRPLETYCYARPHSLLHM